ncbi:MAG: hypothetical protein ABIA67_05350 [Candidatus Margulisiibacteriota bacterium]
MLLNLNSVPRLGAVVQAKFKPAAGRKIANAIGEATTTNINWHPTKCTVFRNGRPAFVLGANLASMYGDVRTTTAVEPDGHYSEVSFTTCTWNLPERGTARFPTPLSREEVQAIGGENVQQGLSHLEVAHRVQQYHVNSMARFVEGKLDGSLQRLPHLPPAREIPLEEFVEASVFVADLARPILGAEDARLHPGIPLAAQEVNFERVIRGGKVIRAFKNTIPHDADPWILRAPASGKVYLAQMTDRPTGRLEISEWIDPVETYDSVTLQTALPPAAVRVQSEEFNLSEHVSELSAFANRFLREVG